MYKIKVDKKELGNVISGDGTAEDAWELVEASEWTQDYKYQYRTIILKRKRDNTYWRYVEARTGSAFSEYHYEDYYKDHFGLVQVRQIEVTVKEWVEV